MSLYNGYIASGSQVQTYATTATSGGTTTLTSTSAEQQYFTGSSDQTVQLPVTSTLILGQSFQIVNNSTGTLTVNSSGGNLVVSVGAGVIATVTCILTSGTTAASWSAEVTSVAGTLSTFNIPNVSGWTSYTPTFTGLGTVSNVDVKWRQVGDSIEISGALITGTATGVTASFTLPGGLSHTWSETVKVGSYGRSAANAEQHALIVQSADKTKVYFSLQTGSFADLNTEVGTDLIGTNENVAFYVTALPISGYNATTAYTVGTPTTTNQSANTVYAGPTSGGAAAPSFRNLVTNDLPTGVVAIASGSSTSVGTGNTLIVPSSVPYDTNSGYSSGTYTVQVTGFYMVGGCVSVAGSQILVNLLVQQNSSTPVLLGTGLYSATTNLQVASGSAGLYCTAGDTIEFLAAVGTGSNTVNSYESYVIRVVG